MSALSTAAVFSGQGPSSNVSTTSFSRRKSYCLKCSKPKPGPPVVSISTMRERPMPPGLLQVGMAVGSGALPLFGVAAAMAAGFAAGAGAAGAGADCCGSRRVLRDMYRRGRCRRGSCRRWRSGLRGWRCVCNRRFGGLRLSDLRDRLADRNRHVRGERCNAHIGSRCRVRRRRFLRRDDAEGREPKAQ